MAAAASAEDAILQVGDLIAAARIGLRRVIGIGSPRASLEANWALRKLVGADNFFVGMAGEERRLVDLAKKIIDEGPSRSCSARDLEQADAMLVLGEDVTNTAPMLDYSLRQWIRRRPTPEQIALKIPAWNDAAVGELVHEEPSALHVLNVRETKLDRLAVQTYHAAPADLARLGFAVAHLLDEHVPEVPDLPKELAEHAAEHRRRLRQGASGPSWSRAPAAAARTSCARPPMSPGRCTRGARRPSSAWWCPSATAWG